MHLSYVLFRRFENTFVRVECSFSLALTLQSSLFHCFVHQLVRVAFCLELILEVDLLAGIKVVSPDADSPEAKLIRPMIPINDINKIRTRNVNVAC